MMTFMKKAVWVGLGMAEKACEAVDNLSKKGEANPSEVAQRIKGFFEQGEQIEDEGKQKIDDLLKRVASGCKIPSQSDIERLEKGLADVADQVRNLTQGRASS